MGSSCMKLRRMCLASRALCFLVQVIYCSKGKCVIFDEKKQQPPWNEILSYSQSRKLDLTVLSTWLSILSIFLSSHFFILPFFYPLIFLSSHFLSSHFFILPFFILPFFYPPNFIILVEWYWHRDSPTPEWYWDGDSPTPEWYWDGDSHTPEWYWDGDSPTPVIFCICLKGV